MGLARKHSTLRLPPKSGRQALAQKLDIELPGRQAVSAEFRQRLLAGESNQEIMEAMGLTHLSVINRSRNIFRKEGVRGRKGLFEKYGRIQNAVRAAPAAVLSPNGAR